MLRRMGRVALSAITAITYLVLAVTPCAPGPEIGRDAPHEHASVDDSLVITAPCMCGCDHSGATSGVAKTGEAVLPLEPAPLLGRAQAPPIELAQRAPDEPIAVESPVPIAS